ncbi:MAG: amino acid ABC transporter ATP-binding protein [Bacilli bacterium]|nr:amino acid ABC transporter ATP-binding protein [Bacilli bacterium]
MIEVRKLKKNFGDKRVLKGINLSINEGDIIGIIGPSGCGKSTFLRCINLLEKPSDGEIILDGVDLCKLNDLTKARQKIGMVFQQFNLFNHLTVMENITLAPVKLNMMSLDAAKREAVKLLKEINLEDKADYYPSELSGGQKQRVAIVRTLIMKPEIILFDEPTSALDPEMIGEVTGLIRKIASSGMTMLIVSHELNFIKSFCTKIIFMNEGKIVEIGTSDEIFNHPKDEKLKYFLSKIKNK